MSESCPAKALRILVAASVLVSGAMPVFAQSSEPSPPSAPITSNTAVSPEVIDVATLQNSSSLLVNQGQTVVIDFGASTVLNLSGNITNNGQLYAVSSNPYTTSATSNAVNITNQQGALFSTVLPAVGLSGITSAVLKLNLVFNAVPDVVNYGSITSSGNLSIGAGG